jgi:hypothetical protein
MPAPALSPAATLDLWADAERRGPVERSLVLAAAADDAGRSAAELSRLPLGRRDAQLLALHGALGGAALEATAACPACGEQAELSVAADALGAHGDEAAPPAPVEAGGVVVTWRSPDSADVAAAGATGDAAAAEEVLLARCVLAVTGPDGELDGAALPAEVRTQLAQAMAAADPLAEVLVDVECPACGTSFVADLDLGGFVWAELRAQAQRLLRDVAVLARAYGWTEAEVFSLDDVRRAAYLELAREGAA